MVLNKAIIQLKSQKNINKDSDVIDNEHHVVMISFTKECWLLKNQQAITVYNQHITDHGVFSDGLRCF